MAVSLTAYEQEMLDGKYAEILGATELVEVTKTHMCCGCEFVPADFPDGDLDKPEMLKEDFYDQHIKN